MQLFIVYLPSLPNDKILVTAHSREDAKRSSHPILRGNPERYVVTPITNGGDTVRLVLVGELR